MEAGLLSGRERRTAVTDYGSALVERARLGDVEAFDGLYRMHRDRVYTLCVDLCGDREFAEDLLQDTFVKAWRGLRRFDGRSSFATWIHRIAVNVSRDAARRRPRQTGGDVRATLTDTAVVDRVRRALCLLKPTYRTALVLQYTLGLSYAEIAETLGWSLSKVKVTIHRAKRAFSDVYTEGTEP